MVDQMAGQEPSPPLYFRWKTVGTGMRRARVERDASSSGRWRLRGRLGREGKEMAEAVEARRRGVERRMATVDPKVAGGKGRYRSFFFSKSVRGIGGVGCDEGEMMFRC